MGVYTWKVEKVPISSELDITFVLDCLTEFDDAGWEFVSSTRLNGFILLIWRKKNL